MKLQHVYVLCCDSTDFPHALGLSIKFGMPQKAANEKGRLVFFYIQIDQTIVRMAEVFKKVVPIITKECNSLPLLQERNDLLICHPSPTDLVSYLADSNPPLL